MSKKKEGVIFLFFIMNLKIEMGGIKTLIQKDNLNKKKTIKQKTHKNQDIFYFWVAIEKTKEPRDKFEYLLKIVEEGLDATDYLNVLYIPSNFNDKNNVDWKKKIPPNELLLILDILNRKYFDIKDSLPILLAYTTSEKKYNDYYTQWFPLWDALLLFCKKNNIDLGKYFPEEWIDKPENCNKIPGEPYLVLKYYMPIKERARFAYKYFEWFDSQFHHQIYYEEIEDGFLWFYNRKCDFISDHMSKYTIEDLNKWLKYKKATLPKEIIDGLVKKFYRK